MTDEKALIKKIIRGDKNSFSLLVKDYKRLVAHIVYTNVKNQNDRDDLCQEIFLKIYMNLDTFKFESKLSTWIGRIAYNSCVNFFKKNKTIWENMDINQEETGDNSVYEVEYDSAESLPVLEIHNRETSRILRQAIIKLPGNYQTIITLFHLDELCYKEIADILNLSVNHIKVNLFRARKLLKEKILTAYSEEDL